MKADRVMQDTGFRMQVEDFACIVHHVSWIKEDK